MLGGIRLLMGRYNSALHMVGWGCRPRPGNRHHEGIVFATWTIVARLGVLRPFRGFLYVQHRNQHLCYKYVNMIPILTASLLFLTCTPNRRHYFPNSKRHERQRRQSKALAQHHRHYRRIRSPVHNYQHHESCRLDPRFDSHFGQGFAGCHSTYTEGLRLVSNK